VALVAHSSHLSSGQRHKYGTWQGEFVVWKLETKKVAKMSRLQFFFCSRLI